MKYKKYVKAWCFMDKKTKKFEPLISGWIDGYGIFETKKALLYNVWNKIPEGYVAKKVKLIIKL